MKDRIFLIIQIALALIILLSLTYYFLEIFPSNKCPPESLKYSACYDFASRTILLQISGQSENSPQLILAETSGRITRILYTPPKEARYVLFSEKNPLEIILTKNSQCNSSKSLKLESCSTEKIPVTLNVYSGKTENITQENASKASSSGMLEKTKVSCASEWQCEDWGECINNIQKRDCKDKNNCIIPSKIPDSSKNCSELCKENWQCEWSECENNFTVPKCEDTNKCRTEFSKPGKIQCINQKQNCIPQISCAEWSECSAEISIKTMEELNSQGARKRICYDSNKCISAIQESVPCSLKQDIYSKVLRICGKDYLEITDKLNSEILARLSYSNNNLDILFTGTEAEEYCQV